MTTTFADNEASPGPVAETAPVDVPGVIAPSDTVDAAFSVRTELALAALTVAGLLGFHRVFRGTGWAGPVIGCALGVQLVSILTRRWVRRPLLAGLIDLGAVGALTAWTVVPSSTTFGIPLRGTWRAVDASFAGFAARVIGATVPVRPTTGFLVLAVAGAGLVAMAGSWIAFRLERTLAATLPSLLTFVACCCLGTRRGRSWTVALEVGAIAAFLLVEQLRPSPSDASSGRRRSAAGVSLRAGLPGIALAGVVALAVVPSLTATDGNGPVGWRSATSSSPRIVISPLVSLATRLLHQSGTDVFTVHSSVPSYWRLTSLDYFDGTEWNARDTYQDVDRTLPGVTAAPRGTRVVREQFHIQDLDSVWLPLAFDPEAVTGAGKVSYDARSGSLLTPRATSDRLDYTVTSLQYLGTLSAPDLAAAPAVRASSTLAPYLQLPASVPDSVRKLARRIVAGARTEYAKAYALQEWFYGPSFTYSLRPPTDGAGTGSLVTFLFQTRTGYCQQFAGSYAVLARAIGLPTRLATGFTTGRPTAGGYQVTDADAHTWPEVWFPHYGWVPFEPTKGTAAGGFAIPGAVAYTGNTAAPPRAGTGPARATTPTTTPATVPTPTPASPGHDRVGTDLPHGGRSVGGPKPVTTPAAVTAPSHHVHHGHRLAALAAVVAALVLLSVSNAVGRRWRWASRRRRAVRAGPRAARRYRPALVPVIWEEAAERLAWSGVRRGAAETPLQFADRVATLRRHDEELPLGSHLHRLADLLAEAQYGAGPVAPEAVEEADQRGRQVATVLARGRRRRERLGLLLDPRWAWAPTTVEASRSVWHDVRLA